MENFFDLLFVIFYCVGAGMSTSMSIADGLDLCIFRRGTEKTRSVEEKMDGMVFISG